MRRLIFSGVVLFLFACISFGEETDVIYPRDVLAALEQAGENRSELEAVLVHYSNPGDSLKLQAAYFLISNMEGHCYVTYVLQDSTGAEIPFNVLDYPDYPTMKKAVDELEEKYGELDFKRKQKLEDLETVTADFLIEQIDYAFRAWREKPWAQGINFDQFCRYILPYRGSNEPLEEWRKYFWDRYKGLENRMDDPSDPLEAAAKINDDIKSWFKFDPRYYLHPTDQGFSEMLEKKMGRCEDMTNLTIYAMRANGLAVTSDYTPYWANSGNNHAWNSIVLPGGKVVPFMGAERNPGEYHLPYKLAKAYRKTFDKQKKNLIFQPRRQEEVPPWLRGKNYQDVTADYTDVADIVYTFDREVPDSVNVAYLCVFNSGEWGALDWGWIKGRKALFTDVGTGIAYLPALWVNADVLPFGSPFILDEDGGIHHLIPDPDHPVTVELVSNTRRKQEASTDGVKMTFLTSGTKYELFYWDGDWRSLGCQTAGEGPLVYEGVPSGALYWLLAEGSKGEEERIFTVEDGRQVWW